MKQLGNCTRPKQLFLMLVCVLIASGCANPKGQSRPSEVPEIRPGLLAGYLPQDSLPNSLALVPAPPVKGSAAFAVDEAVALKNVALRGSPRWILATSDADLSFPNAAGIFSCALDVPVTEEDTPHLYMLLRRTLTDAGLSTYTAKNNYNRARPFVVNQQPMCTPEQKSLLEKDGSYPSGHTAIGWAWALILTELVPDRADAILARGLAYGDSRKVCNVHWNSDVIQGRIMGAAAVAILQSDLVFRSDLEAARAELAAVRTKDLAPVRDCAAEAAALAE